MCAAALTGLFSTSASAVEADSAIKRTYQYIGAGMVRSKSDDLDISLDGFGLGAGLLLSENIYASGTIQVVNDEISGIDVVVISAGADIGYRHEVNAQFDLHADAGYSISRVDTGVTDEEDSSSFDLDLGANYAVNERVVLGAFLGYEIPEEGDNLTSVGVDATLFINDRFSVGMGISKGDDTTNTGLFAALHF